VSFTLHEGEILGIAGLVGSGRTQLARCIFGADKLTRGSVEIDGREATPKSPREAIASGIALVPEDRKAQGLFLDLAVRTNFSISILDRLSGRTGLIARTKERELFERYRTLFGIRLASHLQPVSGLSGGNQQKVVMARWMALDPGILIVDEPTRGVDVGAKAEIYDLLFEMAGRGMAILAISSEIPELLAISDRILVMRSGRIQGELAGDAITESGIGEMMLAD
jgi:inositol transport system ATP-binding protein